MTLRLNGSTSGYVEIDAPAVAGSGLLTLPTGSGTVATEAYVAAADLAAGGLVHINTTTFTSVVEVIVNNVFTTTYVNYLLKFNNISAVNTGNCIFRLRAAGSNIVTNYIQTRFEASGAGQLVIANVSTAFFSPAYISTDTTNLNMDLMSPQLATETGYSAIVQRELGMTNTLASGILQIATQADGYQFAPISGNFSGTVRVYGYKSS